MSTMKTGNNYIIKTTEEWHNTSAKDMIVLEGCLCVEVLSDNNINLKIGLGTKKFSDLPSMVSTDIDMSDYATKTYVTTAIADIDIPVEMTGASTTANGTSGLVPAPVIGDQTKYLRGDGTWGTPAGGGGTIDVDAELSTTSENPVQNKVVTAALNYLEDDSHSHTNKTILDSVTAVYTTDEKTKLAGVAANANAYSHPLYTSHVLGMYKITVDGTGHIVSVANITKDDITGLGIPAEDTTYDAVTVTTDGLMSSTDKVKLDGIAANANNYSHPAYTAHASGLYKVGIDATGHVNSTTAVVKQDILDLGISEGGTTYEVATTTTDGLMASTDKVKLDGIEESANNYSHPEYTAVNLGLYKVAVDATGHVTTAGYVGKEDVTGLGIPSQDTTYELATTTADGLMSSTDKVKLNGVEVNANLYVHPSYTAHTSGLYKITTDATGHVSGTTDVVKADITGLGIPAQDTTYSAAGTELGLVKSGGDVTIIDGTITVDDNSHDHTITNVTGLQTALDAKVNNSKIGVANGVAELDANGFVPASQLPSYVSDGDVIEGYYFEDKFYSDAEHTTEIPGVVAKIYIDLVELKTYRWSGTVFAVISDTITIGELSTTAYRGDRGKTAYDHSQLVTGNPHNVTATDVGLGNVDNVSTNDQAPTYTVASSNTALVSGETISTAFGKIAKIVSSVISHLADAVSHITASERTAWNAKQNALSTGTATVTGTTKLYTATGTRTDGAITQAATTTALGTKADKSTLYQKTLAVASWVGSAAPYTYPVAITGMTSTTADTKNIAYSINFTGKTDDTVIETLIDNVSITDIYHLKTSTDTITFYAKNKPTVDIPINIVVGGDL